jgi:hypothetical protein
MWVRDVVSAVDVDQGPDEDVMAGTCWTSNACLALRSNEHLDRKSRDFWIEVE